MVITETYESNGRTFNRVYSDSGRYVVRDGVSYEEACDPVEYNREYTEGDIITTEEEGEYATAGRIMMGVDT